MDPEYISWGGRHRIIQHLCAVNVQLRANGEAPCVFPLRVSVNTNFICRQFD